jgi:hypothetical protein
VVYEQRSSLSPNNLEIRVHTLALNTFVVEVLKCPLTKRELDKANRFFGNLFFVLFGTELLIKVTGI